MDLDFKTCVVAFLIGFALYLLVNRVFMVEGMKDSGEPENSSDCNRLCEVKRVGLRPGQQCVYDKNCEDGGIGCNIGGINLCRLCDNDESTDYNLCASYPPSSTPSPSSVTPPSVQPLISSSSQIPSPSASLSTTTPVPSVSPEHVSQSSGNIQESSSSVASSS